MHVNSVLKPKNANWYNKLQNVQNYATTIFISVIYISTMNWICIESKSNLQTEKCAINCIKICIKDLGWLKFLMNKFLYMIRKTRELLSSTIRIIILIVYLSIKFVTNDFE